MNGMEQHGTQLLTKQQEMYKEMAATMAKEMAAKHKSYEAIPPEEMRKSIANLERDAISRGFGKDPLNFK
jgi:hypothetical protein